MREFYVGTLELRPRSDRDQFVNFEFDRFRITIAVHDALFGEASEPARVMVNLACDDLDARFAKLTSAGCPAIRAPSAEPWGGRVATTADPDGNIIQLLEIQAAP